MNHRIVLRQQRFLLSYTCCWVPRAYWADAKGLHERDGGVL